MFRLILVLCLASLSLARPSGQVQKAKEDPQNKLFLGLVVDDGNNNRHGGNPFGGQNYNQNHFSYSGSQNNQQQYPHQQPYPNQYNTGPVNFNGYNNNQGNYYRQPYNQRPYGQYQQGGYQHNGGFNNQGQTFRNAPSSPQL